MSQNGWVKLEGEVALENAQLTARFLKENGISKHDHRRTISL
jgi:hypothetical protein